MWIPSLSRLLKLLRYRNMKTSREILIRARRQIVGDRIGNNPYVIIDNRKLLEGKNDNE